MPRQEIGERVRHGDTFGEPQPSGTVWRSTLRITRQPLPNGRGSDGGAFSGNPSRRNDATAARIGPRATGMASLWFAPARVTNRFSTPLAAFSGAAANSVRPLS